MALELNKTVETSEPVVDVVAPPKPGMYRVQLVVVNDKGIESAPFVMMVTVRKPRVNSPGGNPQ